jgi:glycosyltransferase involved in cell wall biosynthesis
MLKVVLISLEWPHAGHVGGVGRYAFRIADELKTKVDLTVVTMDGGDRLEGATMVFVPRVTGRLSRYYLTPLRLRRVVASLNVDIVHAFGDDWALAAKNVPIVRTFMGSSLAEARSSRGLRRLNHYVLALTEARSKAHAALKIAIGPDSFETFDCQMLMPPVTQLPPPIGVTKTENPSVVFVGSNGGRKRGWLVENAVAEVEAATGISIDLTVVGPSADRANWLDGTKHISGASDERVREEIASSWVLMAPSEYEGFGIPLYEAMALGTYGIATRNPGTVYIHDSVRPSPPIDIVADSALGAALKKRLEGGGHLNPNEAESARAAVNFLSSEASVDHLVEVYDRLCR